MRTQQSGSVAVMGAAGMAVLLSALLVIDIASVFSARRGLQKMADAAALAAVHALGDDCAGAQAAALAVANSNGFPADGSIDTDCGNWAVDEREQTPQNLSNYFTEGAPGTGFDAVRVRLQRSVPYFFVFGGDTSRTVSAEGTASDLLTDTFSVGSGLADLNSANPVNALLSQQFGSNVNLTLASYQGMANARIRLIDLARADPLNFGTVDELVNASVSLGDLLLATATVTAPVDESAASALQTLASTAPNTQVLLSQMLMVQAPTGVAKAAARITAFDLLMTAAQAANHNHVLDFGTMVNIPGVASVTMQVVQTEKPRSATGRAGVSAHSAQTRVRLRIQGLQLSSGPVTLSSLNLPIFLESAPATATLGTPTCGGSPPETSSVPIDLQRGLLQACLSGVSAANLGSAADPCATAATVAQASVPVVGMVQVNGAATLEIGDNSVTTLIFGQGGPADSSVYKSVQRVDSSPSSTTAGTAAALAGSISLSTQPAVAAALIDPTLQAVHQLLNDTAANAALIAQMQSTVDPLLRLLGISVGFTDVFQQSLTCKMSELMY